MAILVPTARSRKREPIRPPSAAGDGTKEHMSRAPLIATSVLIGAALGAAAVSFAPSVREAELADRLSDLEQELVDARRDASDWELVAATERERKRIVEEEVASLRIAVANPAPRQPAEGGDAAGRHGSGTGMRVDRERATLAPENWDGARLRLEMQRLAMHGRRMATSSLLDACAKAAETQGDEAFQMLVDTLREAGLPANVRLAATMVLEKLQDERAVPVLLGTLPTTAEWAQRRAILRALANLPGETQTQTFVDLWYADDGDGRLRMVAAHALARRANPVAIAIVDGTEAVADAALRARAIDSLHGYARERSYRNAELIPTFGAALVTAAGEGQIRVSLLALEGYWRPECVPYLRSLQNAENVSEELRERGRRVADAIEAKAPRPEGAGEPASAPPSPVDDQGGDEGDGE